MESNNDFDLDEQTKQAVEQGLAMIGEYPTASFEEKARMLVGFLTSQGIEVEQSEVYGDVLIPQPSGWGYVALLNEEARISSSAERCEYNGQV
jgi:hypothetical protein